MKPIKKAFLFLAILALAPLALEAQEDADFAIIRTLLQKQNEDWNRGDIDAFMQAYWKSDQLQFIGGNGITKGWQQTLDNYKKRYPTRDAMGTLKFGIVSMERLSKKVIFLVGTWDLTRKSDNPGGYFILIWRKIGGQWVITTDHTSSRA